ncbi:MAG: CehA/McbA family metallohydrolase [Armatimonadota bacterium]
MGTVAILADMAGKHTAHDVYDLWVQRRTDSILFGWETAAGGNRSFCLDGDGNLHPVAVPWQAEDQRHVHSISVSPTGHVLSATHIPEIDGSPNFFGVQAFFDERFSNMSAEEASLLFPSTCFAFDDTMWVAMVQTEDVINDDGVIDQHNYIVIARREADEWIFDEVADLAYGLLPKNGVWGYPGKRRHPYLVPDDDGGMWVMWERKEPHDGSTTQVGGVLVGRKFHDDEWADPVRIIEEPYMDYVVDKSGVINGEIIVAAQRGVPDDQPGRGEVVLLSVDIAGSPTQRPDTGFEGWSVINLPEHEFFTPEDRSVEVGGEDYELLFGDPHSHTALSEDAEGDLVEMISYAQNKAQVDFVAITDNDYIYGGRLSDRNWQETMERTEAWSEDDRFIVIPAYEWTQRRWGPSKPQHRSILFESYDQPMLRWKDAGFGLDDDPFVALLSWIQSTNGIMNTQHARFLLSDSDRECNMEVVCGWGDYINTSPVFHEHLNDGFKVGFVGTSDGHRRTPGLGGGLTGLWVREFTLSGIIDAFRQNRCYATAGTRIGLKFWVNGAFMGQQTEQSDEYTARVSVQAPREVESVEIFGDGEVVAELSDLPAGFDEQITGLPECAWYYAKVTLPGGFPQYPSNIAPAEGPWAWSSPVFVIK